MGVHIPYPRANERVGIPLAATVLVVVLGLPLFGPPRENGSYSFRTFYLRFTYFLATDPF